MLGPRPPRRGRATALKLSDRPGLVRSRLEQSKHGCSWLVGRWEALQGIWDQTGEWTEAQRSLALDLLGVAPELRTGRTAVDAAAEEGGRWASRRQVMTLELERLRGLETGALAALDARERDLAAQGLWWGPEERRLRRYARSSTGGSCSGRIIGCSTSVGVVWSVCKRRRRWRGGVRRRRGRPRLRRLPRRHRHRPPRLRRRLPRRRRRRSTVAKREADWTRQAHAAVGAVREGRGPRRGAAVLGDHCGSPRPRTPPPEPTAALAADATLAAAASAPAAPTRRSRPMCLRPTAGG